MIDRLEELLEQVEETEEGGETLVLPQPSGRKVLSAAREASGVETEIPLSGSIANREESLSHKLPERGETANSVLFRAPVSVGETSGLAGLYRQLSRSLDGEGASRPASVAVVHESISAPVTGLTAGELDLAMKRDSRRYDGGMTIY